MANHHFKMTSQGFECTDCNGNQGFVSSILNSPKKIEMLFSNKITKQDFELGVRSLKDRNIMVDYNKTKFNDNFLISDLDIKIYLNDKYKGKTIIPNFQEKTSTYGFILNFLNNGDIEFKAGEIKK